jgi:hypothetical protein
MTAASIIAVFASFSLAPLALSAQEVDVCNPAHLQGAYGFQLSGRTTISGSSKPVASIGRLEFDGHGVLSGTSSVNFAGYFLGNPVTGKYEAHDDCTLSWSVQDDSGGWQHFEGRLTPDLSSAQFRQTDAGGAQNGTMQKVSPTCSTNGLAQRYGFTVTGTVIPMNPGDPAAHRIESAGTAETDPAGALKLTIGSTTGTGTISIDGDCIATVALTLPSGDTLALRGVLVNSGKRILAVETDPGTTATGSFTAK